MAVHRKIPMLGANVANSLTESCTHLPLWEVVAKLHGWILPSDLTEIADGQMDRQMVKQMDG